MPSPPEDEAAITESSGTSGALAFGSDDFTGQLCPAARSVFNSLTQVVCNAETCHF